MSFIVVFSSVVNLTMKAKSKIKITVTVIIWPVAEGNSFITCSCKNSSCKVFIHTILYLIVLP